MVGKLIPDFFPKIFGPQQNQPLDADAVRAAFAQLAREIGDGRSAEEVADGFIKIAVENMANAIKKISVQRGYDVTRYALNCFGGAGGQHACLVADALGMTKVLIHPFSSLLSAYGMGLADIRATRQQAIEEPFGDAVAGVDRRAIGGRLGEDARSEVAGQGVPPAADQRCIVRAHIRYAGTDTALVVPAFVTPSRRDAAALDCRNEIRLRDGAQIALRLHRREQGAGGRSGLGRGHRRRREVHRAGTADDAANAPARPTRRTQFYLAAANGTRPRSIPATQLAPGHAVRRPRHRHRAAPDHRGRGRLARRASPPRTTWCSSAPSRSSAQSAIGTEADPVMLEVFNNLFMSIAEQMGVSLQNTAYSVNIKERLDFSCAVFAADGTLVANAPHMPVHLGSMDRAVETIIRENKGRIAPGDVYAINAPYNGGTHLPDITVCTPVFDEARREDPVLGRLARPSRRRRRHLARLDVAERDHDRGGRRLYRQLQAGRSRPLPRAGALRPRSPARNIPRATRCRTSTT